MRYYLSIFCVCMNLYGLTSCDNDTEESNLPSLSSSFKKTANQGMTSSDPDTPPSQEEVRDAVFRCSTDSATIMRFSEENARMEYCRKGEWAAIPKKNKPRILPKKSQTGPEGAQMMPLDISDSQVKPEISPDSPNTLVHDPLAFRCQKSKRFENSFLCHRSYPDP